MKIRNLMGAFLALAGLAFGGSVFAAGGDIVDIRAVDSSGMRFGSRSRESGMYSEDMICSEKNPLVAGETVYFRVRMQVLNAYEVWSSGGVLTPKTWRFWDVAKGNWAEDGVGPKLGLSIGNRIAFADFSPTGVEFTQFSGELQYDDNGNATTAYRYYTDFYFRYKVQPGDVGQPIRLINKDLGIPSATEISSVPYGFLGLNVGSAAYELKNEDGTEANLCRAAGLAAAWPTGPWTDTAWDGAILSYDLSQEGVFVKTVDFDKYDAAGDLWQPGKPWRRVTPGGYDKSCPAATLAVEGDVPAEDTIPLYVWSGDTNVFTIAGGSSQTINIGTTDDPKLVDVYTVQIQKGRTASDAITLRGAPGVALTASAEIFMTSTKGVVTYDAAGTPKIVAMSRPITVTEAQPPTVKIRINNRTDTQPKVPVVADSDYTTPKADLWVIVEGETATKTVVDLRATVGGSGSLTTLVKNNIIRLSESDYPTEQADSVGQVEIPAGTGTRQAIVHLYALGTDDDARTDGIKFQPVVISGDPEVTLDKSPSSNVVIDRQGEEAIKFIQTNPADGSSKTLTKTDSWTIRVKFADSYRNYFKPKAGAPYTYAGYTFKFMDDETGDEFVFAEGVTPASAGSWISVTGKVNWDGFAIGSHPDMYFYGEAMDGSTTERIRYTINLTTSTKVVTVGLYDPTHPTTVCESDTGAIEVKLGLKSPYENGYIFLRPSTDSDAGLVESDLFTYGAAIDSEDNMQVTNPGLVRYLDGKEGVGTPVVVKAFLGPTYDDPTATVANWAEGQLRLIVTNRAPVVKALKVANMNFKASDSGKVTTTVPSGVEKKFALTSVDDVKADWDSMDIKWVIGETVVEKHGDPTNEANTVTHTFSPNLAGKAVEVEVYVKDKDMTTYPDLPNFFCTVPIGTKPGVRIETEGTISDTFLETATDGSQTVRLTLSEPATEEMEVKFTVGNPSNGNGYILFQTTEGVVEAGETANEYVVKFPATVTTRTLRVVKVGGMDGTGTTEDGVVLNAEVTTATVNADGILWKDYFSAADPLPVYVQNVAPQFKHPNDLECATTNESASINTPYSIKIQAADVPADVTNRWTYAGQEVQGIRFEVSVDNVPLTNGFLTVSNVVSAIQATDLVMVNVEFDSVGVHTVEVVFEDKDGAGLDDPRQIIFNVKSSKVLKLFPVGPGPANSTLGSAYAGYPGIGAGRVFAGLASQGPQKIENFIHTYSFLNTQKDVDAWAFGYLADGKADDGELLPGPDRGIDATGNWNKTMTIDDYYNYTEDHKYGKSGYDSFMYGWIGGAASDDGEVEAKLFPYLQKTGYRSIALPDGNSNSGSKDEVKTYPLQKWEAVFSREFLRSDNCGDINADGIPDCILFGYGLGIVDVVTKEITGEGGDKADASKFNGDQNPNPRGYAGESTEGDFLPVEPIAMYDDLIPGLVSSWDEPFTAILEVRGITSERNTVSALNDALAPEFPDGTVNRLAQPEFESDVCFLDPDTNPTSTLSRVEFMAWREYAAAHGIADPDDPASWRKNGRLVWSPERPTDPTLVDTDGDGFPDGYEYYYWYRAHVGWIDANGVHRYLTGRKYDPRNPGEGTLITSEDLEIAMDPIVPSGNLEQDTDNDGLPDILEMVIGTNPFDFDTDGDGLPDGFEIMLCGTDPLLAYTAKTICDAMRNFDGDAMAFTTPKLEGAVEPKPTKIDALVAFALVDEDGDTDGVQWYVGKSAPDCLGVLKQDLAGTSLKVGGKTYVTSASVAVVTNEATGAVRLAADLPKASTWTAVPTASLTGDIPALAEITETSGFVALMPTHLPAGTEVSAVDSAAAYATLQFTNAVKNVNAAWVYGRAINTVSTVDDALTGFSGFGMLAIGRYKDAPAKKQIAALPEGNDSAAYLHYLVYQEFEFDPRTAWNPYSPLGERWGNSLDTAAGNELVFSSEKVYANATRTRAFTMYDEFLVLSFFLNNGTIAGDEVVASQANTWATIWSRYTTNGQGPDELEPFWDESNEDFKGRTAETTDSGVNGADSDQDGVPDGWELYVMAGPKQKGKFHFAGPYSDGCYSSFGPFVGDAASATVTDNGEIGETGLMAGDKDGLTELREFAGTDSCKYYSEPWNGNKVAYSATIVRPDEDATWFNKFFPTDPWNADTDGDGLPDAETKDKGEFKASRFLYGTPVDDGSRCIPGGGLNPCTVDTDLDGLPDPWEAQFAGEKIFTGEGVEMTKDATGKEGNPKQGLCDGMDGTVFDAYNSPRKNTADEKLTVTLRTTLASAAQVVDRDYDRDGLSNWQEYLTGAMRCWRYDDPITRWDAIPYGAYFDALGNFDLTGAIRATGSKNANDFWYKTLFDRSSPWYNPHLVTDISPAHQYFTRVKNGWDLAYGLGNSYYIFHDRVGDAKLEDIWGDAHYGVKRAPTKYICTSPLKADTDQDGMDDYWELFHGLNPLLGEVKVLEETHNPCDIVYDAWYIYPSGSPVDALVNIKMAQDAELGISAYDFVAHPWMNGHAAADPDGDDIRNQDEAIMPLTAPGATWHHTDPTPLWMTDSSYSNSLVSLFFCSPCRFLPVTGVPKSVTAPDGTRLSLVDCDGYSDGMIIPFVPDAEVWMLSAGNCRNWIFSFEENEGYDSDHDGTSDYEELQGKVRNATDPQDADSPRRRQAMYFPGPSVPSALQSMPFVPEYYPRATFDYPDDMSFLQYTVECWVCPESTADATVIERTSYVDPSHCADERYIRRNFSLSIRDGKWCTAFDSNGTLDKSLVEVLGKTDVTPGKWTYLAATFDANRLTLYVNGSEEGFTMSNLKPEYGSSAITVYPGDGTTSSTNGVKTGDAEALDGDPHTYWTDREYALHAFLIGASFTTETDGNYRNSQLNVMNGSGWQGNYKDFFTGYVDEIRVWDGAQDAGTIASNYRTRRRYTREDAIENRSAFFNEWVSGRRRYTKDSDGVDVVVLPELRFHWSFDSIPGAENAVSVAQAPHGFLLEGAKAQLSSPAGYEIPWWSAVLDGYGSVYAGHRNWVPWIPNTVTHLPRFDLTTLDSFYWSENFAGDTAGTYLFARTAEPVSFWTQMTLNLTSRSTEFRSTDRRFWLAYNSSTNTASTLDDQFEFTGRHLNQLGDDLLPLGGAFARYVETMWDDQGASSMQEQTGSDADNDGLPDWWQEYAEQNYRKGLQEGETISWDTMIWYEIGGVETRIRAGEAYQRDLAKGTYVDAAGKVHIGPTAYAQTARSDGMIPDWWKELNKIDGEDPFGDLDNDGLNNYVEYVASELLPFQLRLDPRMAKSDTKTLDYFRKVGRLYLGEMLTDHDQMEDHWERSLDDEDVADTARWDALADAEEDGWVNFDENRYNGYSMSTLAQLVSHAVGGTETLDAPIPTLRLKVRYNGDRPLATTKEGEGGKEDEGNDLAPALIVSACSKSAATGEYVQNPDAVWSVTPGVTVEKEVYLGGWEERTVRGTMAPGNIDLGTLNIKFAQVPQSDLYSWTDEAGTHISRPYSEFKKALDKDPSIIQNIQNFEWLELYAPVNEYTSSDRSVTVTRDALTQTAHIEVYGQRVGTVNLTTGDFEFDMAAMNKLRYNYTYDGGKTVASSWGFKEAIFKITYSATVPSAQLRDVSFSLSKADRGFVRGGMNSITAFYDLDGSGAYTPGEPFGVVNDVEIGWCGRDLEIELSDMSAITPRVNLWESSLDAASDRAVHAGVGEVSDGTAFEPVTFAHRALVTVSRYRVDGKALLGLGEGSTRKMLRKTFESDSRNYLHEGDFLANGALDIDWDCLYDDIVADKGVWEYGCATTNVTYLITYNWDPNEYLENDEFQTLPACSTLVMRRFEMTRTVPTACPKTTVFKTASPTFSWRIDNEDKWASWFGTTYTAFKVRVKDTSGNLVYDSGIRRLPAKDSAGVYSWTAPLFTGVPAPGTGVLFQNLTDYTWEVALYNAKFRTDELVSVSIESGLENDSTGQRVFSAPEKFRMNVTALDVSSESLAARVCYSGPATNLLGRIHVQAFASPDFTGEPLSETVLRCIDIRDTLSPAGTDANAELIGLPAGSYFLRAYIDTNGNCVRDEWESWGYLNERDDASKKGIFNPVAIATAVQPSLLDARKIFIEDCDTDGDWFPDVWEAENNAESPNTFVRTLEGPLTGTAELIGINPELKRILNSSEFPMFEKLGSTSGLALISGIPPTSVRTIARSDGTLGILIDNTVESVKVTSLDFDADGNVVIAVDAATTVKGFDDNLSRLYGASIVATKSVTCNIYRKSSLAEKNWTKAGGQVVTVGGGKITITVSGGAAAQGFYKAVIVE